MVRDRVAPCVHLRTEERSVVAGALGKHRDHALRVLKNKGLTMAKEQCLQYGSGDSESERLLSTAARRVTGMDLH